ncbi:uncharacterized protein AKAW2_70945S [Aspergillus luchuensis]|uniref:Uncharacterized protein n=1 Tax=Aspergillus kawachii TaxID=1069201 RepID=A0A7R7WJB5_ASPKA|nr:uncharacterized protein AKAW2_70945S [Aspergillus luchuensis]BCS04067.1 hypothetical protein AKAW2_70945S [Aspergillus luchuensis]
MDSPPVARVEWKFHIQSKWQDFLVGKDNGSATRTRYQGSQSSIECRQTINLTLICSLSDHQLQSTVTFAINHDCPLDINATDYDIAFDIRINDMENQWDITDDWYAIEGDWLEMFNQWVYKDDKGPSDAVFQRRQEKMRELRPTFHFGTLGLGFFLTTNLLNPGAKVIEIDKQVGMRVPGDLLLVGKVVQAADPTSPS